VKKIATIYIDVEKRITLEAQDAEGNNIVWPTTPDGGLVMKVSKSSAGGLIIQALVRMLEDRT
jgi:hypothetical protein